MHLSIKDVAQAAGVSHSTVSRALSDSPLVSPETKARIRRLAQEMGYFPDAIARSLVLRQTRTVGVVVTSIADPFVAGVVENIEDTAQKNGYSVILTGSAADPQRELAAVEMLRAKRVDGVVVISSRVGALYQEHLERIGAPVVLVNSHGEQSGRYTFSVSVDNRHGGHLATAYLILLGHRRIAYVAGPAGHSDDAQRMAGYRQALDETDRPFDPAWVIPGNGRLDGGERALHELIGRPTLPTAIFCYNDMTALGVIAAARRVGLAVPGDLSVVGFDDIPVAARFFPSLTTVAQPQHDLGQQAMEMVLALIAAGEATASFSNVEIRGKLVVRESAGPATRASVDWPRGKEER